MPVKQECIAEECVPSAALAVWGGCLPGVVSTQGGVCLGGVHLPPRGQTDTCENITFPQLLLRTVNIAFPQLRLRVIKIKTPFGCNVAIAFALAQF